MSFFRKKAEVLNHWIGFVSGFSTSPTEFYSSLEQNLTECAIPKMEARRIELSEGGLLSEKRVYLRLVRERLVFDICAAPFGTGFFFSCRTAEIPIVIRPLQVIAVIILMLFFVNGTMYFIGFFRGLIVSMCVLAFGIYFIRNVVALGLQDLDKVLLESSLVGSIYAGLFRKETYHRIDSRLCFLEIVPTLVKKLAEDTTAAKGVKLVRQYELSPILGELYKPARPTPPISPAV